MKKILFAIAALVAMSFASCGGNTETANESYEEEDTILQDSVVEGDTLATEAAIAAEDTTEVVLD